MSLNMMLVIGVGGLFIAVLAVWFALRVVKIAVRESKSNINVVVSEPKKKLGKEDVL